VKIKEKLFLINPILSLNANKKLTYNTKLIIKRIKAVIRIGPDPKKETLAIRSYIFSISNSASFINLRIPFESFP